MKTEKSTPPIVSVSQLRKEIATSLAVIQALEVTIRAIWDAGITDPQTAQELSFHVEAAQAAAYRWQAEAVRHGCDLKTDPA